jgi:hypothetical protein
VKRAHVLAYISVPALWALYGLVLGLRREPLTLEALASYLVGGYVFYAVPYIAWAIIAAVIKPIIWAWHAGFIAASSALVLISALSLLGRHDPSGLPYEWLIYWPLAGILITSVIFVWWLKGHRHAGV